MKSLQIRTQVSPQGQVLLEMPLELANQKIDLLIVFETVNGNMEALIPTDALGWPRNFFTEIAGSMPDFPDIEDEGDFEVRESWE